MVKAEVAVKDDVLGASAVEVPVLVVLLSVGRGYPLLVEVVSANDVVSISVSEVTLVADVDSVPVVEWDKEDDEDDDDDDDGASSVDVSTVDVVAGSV